MIQSSRARSSRVDPPPEDEALRAWVSAMVRRETDALALLYGQTSRYLLPVLLRLLRRHDLAEEALHDVYLKAWERAGDYRAERGSVMAWLITMARSTALDQLRRRRREVPLVDEDDPLANLASEGLDQTSAARRALQACLDQLEPEPRRCVLLAYHGGLTYEEMARRLDRPINTVKSWIRRSLVRLRLCLEAR